VITLDTSGILAALNNTDPDHVRARAALEAERGPLIVPVGILAEAGYVIEADLGAHILRRWLAYVVDGSLTLDCGESDMERIIALLERYEDLSLGFAGACVIACAERNGARVLTFDERDLPTVAREKTISLVPGVG
jgi:predicted nucleic acid-binding protein